MKKCYYGTGPSIFKVIKWKENSSMIKDVEYVHSMKGFPEGVAVEVHYF